MRKFFELTLESDDEGLTIVGQDFSQGEQPFPPKTSWSQLMNRQNAELEEAEETYQSMRAEDKLTLRGGLLEHAERAIQLHRRLLNV